VGASPIMRLALDRIPTTRTSARASTSADGRRSSRNSELGAALFSADGPGRRPGAARPEPRRSVSASRLLSANGAAQDGWSAAEEKAFLSRLGTHKSEEDKLKQARLRQQRAKNLSKEDKNARKKCQKLKSDAAKADSLVNAARYLEALALMKENEWIQAQAVLLDAMGKGPPKPAPLQGPVATRDVVTGEIRSIGRGGSKKGR
jgi:hypothetical protein